MQERIRNISLWFRTHFAERIDFDEVAAANRMSHDRFYKLWKKNFDMSPNQFLIDLRLEAAARRLRESRLPVSEIVREVHFAGEYMFYRRFRAKFGMTPGAYRERREEDDSSAN